MFEEEGEVYSQKYFEDIESVHWLLKSNPVKIFDLFEELKQFMINMGHTDPEESKSLAITLMTFPFAGKAEMDEEEVAENYNKLLGILEHGIFSRN